MNQSNLKHLKIEDISIYYEEIPDFDQQLLDKIELGYEEHECPFYGEVWPAAFELCKKLANLQMDGKTTLEVGCGLAIPSILSTLKGAHSTACDHNKEAGDLLWTNARHNGVEVKFSCVDWVEETPISNKFDIIFASDILYRPEQFSFIVRLLKSVSKMNTTIIVTDPGRVARDQFVSKMNKHFLEHKETKNGDIWTMEWTGISENY